MSERATKHRWKTLEPPKTRASLAYEADFSEADAERLRAGHIPKSMEDKWFAYFENDWLYLHRSWTGALIYWLKLDQCPNGVRVVESWVSRDTEWYRETDTSYDRLLLDYFLCALILGHEAKFPKRPMDIAAGSEG